MKKIDAINHFGSAVALARALDLTKQAVGQWPDEIPIGRAYQIEVLTGGKLKAKDDKSEQAA